MAWRVAAGARLTPPRVRPQHLFFAQRERELSALRQAPPGSLSGPAACPCTEVPDISQLTLNFRRWDKAAPSPRNAHISPAAAKGGNAA